jgi:hypothetical protein
MQIANLVSHDPMGVMPVAAVVMYVVMRLAGAGLVVSHVGKRRA